MKKSPLTTLLSDIPNKLGKANEANKMVQAIEKTVMGKFGGVRLIKNAIKMEPPITTSSVKGAVFILRFILNFFYQPGKSI